MDFRINPGNTPLDPTEAEGLIPKIWTLKELNQTEGQNILLARRWAMKDRSIQANLLSSTTLRQLHERMFSLTWKWAGTYRLTQKSIGIEAFRIPTELKILVDDVKAWIEFGTYSPDEIATRFHHRLVQIHAFPNGNGRHARLATDLLCSQLGIEAFSWGAKLSLEPVEIRRRYIAALQMADAHDYSEILLFVRA